MRGAALDAGRGGAKRRRSVKRAIAREWLVLVASLLGGGIGVPYIVWWVDGRQVAFPEFLPEGGGVGVLVSAVATYALVQFVRSIAWAIRVLSRESE